MTDDEALLLELVHGAFREALPPGVAFNAALLAANKGEAACLRLTQGVKDNLSRELLLLGHVSALVARLAFETYQQHKREQEAGK